MLQRTHMPASSSGQRGSSCFPSILAVSSCTVLESVFSFWQRLCRATVAKLFLLLFGSALLD